MFSKTIAAVTFMLILTGIVKSQDYNYKPGEIIVMLKYNTDASYLEIAFASAGLKVKQPLVEELNIWLYEFETGRTNENVLLSQLRKNGSVAVAQFNHYVTERSLFPNDPQFTQQWSLNNTGQSGGNVDSDIDAPEAWGVTTGGVTALGDTIVIAIIDGGFYLTHQDINFWKNYKEIPGNGIDDDTNGYIDDFNGWNAYNNNGTISGNTHGSHVSGIAAATGNNSLGVAGVNWGARILPVMGSTGTESIVLIAYGYVLKQRRLYNQTNGAKGAFIVSTNSSFGVDYGQPQNYPLWCAFYDSLGSAGILNACATANLNINVDVQGDIPTACSSPFMVSVTNTTNTDAKNNGAAYGLLTIDLGAPGTSILSTTTAGNYGLLTGTSMATPHVAGAIALMYAGASSSFIQAYKNDPDSFALIVKQKLLQGVDVIPALQNITVSGGRLNVFSSIMLMPVFVSNGQHLDAAPKYYRLYDNYPNPFNPSTAIKYDVAKASLVTIKIYDEIGREVKTLINMEMQPGTYQAIWNAANVSTGIYYYKITAGDFTQTKKMVLIK
ncbi:MAG: T9SS C-terminal target domain-containing protein [Ignavibacteriae bacterium]|nr:MAG: T9SS C-terminal target domain-containing protein [Ignavibacteriota bacterium]